MAENCIVPSINMEEERLISYTVASRHVEFETLIFMIHAKAPRY